MDKHTFFQRMEELGIALTFDDVRLETDYSEVLPDAVSLETKLSRNVPLKIPIVSAAMDTVTEHTMAIALAKAGGLGFIHKKLSPTEQAAQVARVKYHLNGLIEKPICVSEDETLEAIQKKREEKNYTFHSFPVTNREGTLVGILTQNDFDFCPDTKLHARDVMTRNVITAPQGTSLSVAYELMIQHKKKAIPIIDEHHHVTGLYVFGDLKRIKSGISSLYNTDHRGQLRVGAAIGTGPDTPERLERLIAEHVDVVVIDTAHAHTKTVLQTLRNVKQRHPQLDVVVGNISRDTSTVELIEAGADGIRVGQGPGSICTTRVVAGIGCPQVTAVYRCATAAEKHGVPVMADGGLTYSGDITIALAAGATSVMLGSMLAGTREAPGDVIYYKGRQWKLYRGMGSLGAMLESRAAQERYNQQSDSPKKLVPEGVEGLIPYKGDLHDTLFQYLGGLRSGMGYIGARTIHELQYKAQFFRMTQAGQKESHPHDIHVIREAPNYPTPDPHNEEL